MSKPARHPFAHCARLLALVIALSGLQSCAQFVSDFMLPSGETAELSHFASSAPQVGMPAPSFHLLDLEGNTSDRHAIARGRPLVLAFGSYSCPVFRERFELFEDLAEEFANDAVFAIVYTVESHPMNAICPYTGEEWDTVFNKWAGIRIEQAETFEERLSVARDMAKTLGVDVPVLVDSMDNATWSAFGAAPASAFLIDRNGLVVKRQVWFEPRALRRALAALPTPDARDA